MLEVGDKKVLTIGRGKYAVEITGARNIDGCLTEYSLQPIGQIEGRGASIPCTITYDNSMDMPRTGGYLSDITPRDLKLLRDRGIEISF
ncbi:MAG: hypothetical protein HZB67_05100 [Candidatus Aenigmarchaeota archaeon]|nr:hypothetical protein [Candidatus Aenigmarchaeota archaeon]